MKALLLAAGTGTRLRPITSVLPKCLVPINGRPLMDYWLDALVAADIEHVLINLHYLSGMVAQWLDENQTGITIQTAYEAELLGTAGTLRQNSDFFEDRPMMLIHADNLIGEDLKNFRDAHVNRPRHTVMTMMTFSTPTPHTCGIVQIDDDGVIQGFYEKVDNPPGNLANAAVYIIEPEVINFIKSMGKKKIDFSTEVIPHFLGRIFSYRNRSYHRDIGNLESLLDAQVEYDAQPKLTNRNDSWKKMCERDERFLCRQMEEALLFALDAVNLDPSKRLSPVEQTDRPFFVGLERSGSIQALIDNLPVELQKKLILYVHCAGEHFSSKELFDHHGIRSLAMYVA